MSTPTIKIYNQQAQIDVLVKSFQGPTGPQGKGLTDAQIQAAIDATDNANAAREAIQGDLNQLKDTKADAIMDTSARAAVHELHAQDGRMFVTLYGKTTETGTGDKSPDNPYSISGVALDGYYDISANASNGWLVKYDNDSEIHYAIGIEGIASRKTGLEPSVIFCNHLPVWVQYYSNGTRPTGAHIFYRDYNMYKCELYVPGFTTKEEYVAWLSANPTQVWYAKAAGDGENGVVAITAKSDDGLAYSGNVIPLLPDGAPLMGNGTVYDTIEPEIEPNALSGCDRKRTFTGVENWQMASAGWFYVDLPSEDVATNGYAADLSTPMYANWMTLGDATASGAKNRFNWIYSGGNKRFICATDAGTVDELKAHLAANPLTVYCRSTDYTPDKDLMMCKVVRKWKEKTVDTSGGYTSVFTVLGDCCRASFPISPGNVDAKTGYCDILPYAYDYNGDYEHAYISASNAFIFVKTSRLAEASYAGANAWVKANTPKFWYPLATPEIYMTDPIEARKPDTLTTDTVTVTGSGETEVTYPHTTKHYIDSQIAAAVALALNG